MRHTTLYRKWRPRRFSEIVGQEPVVRTLSRAIETERLAHAYLFSGPRGTGKTSTAKVLAMGLNCVKGPTPEPDGTCESCRAIVNNSSLDVVEMDAASNRGIDEIRDLRDRVNLAPVAGRMKVYIIDEVHMLTAEAFNALLKMLEEPPEHVVFVLATTEKHKVLPTITSRCQSFDFRRPGVETLKDKLAEIAEAERIEVEPEALTVIAREGRGSFRDAEGLLDQLSSFAEGLITASMVRELLGSVGPEALLETTSALYERRAADALRIVDRLSNEGRDLGQLVTELISHLRTLMLLPHAPEIALAEVGADERGSLEEQAHSIPTAEVVRLIEAMDAALGRIKRGGDPKLELELSFLKLTRDYTEPEVGNLLRRLEELEREVANGAASPRAERSLRSEAPPPPREEPVDAPADEAGSAGTPDDESGDEGEEPLGAEASTVPWPRILQDLKARRPAVAAVYEGARLESFDGTVLELSFPEELAIYVKLAGEPKRLDPLMEVLEEHLGASPRLEFRVGDGVPVEVAQEPPPPADSRAPAPKVEDVGDETPDISGIVGGPGAQGSSSEGAGSSDVIRDQREVFEMARERGLLDQH
ncbi:MAG TPA: DNA polymerase III subunit gamma/tau, partial [Rubrobacteraceae bacterium]|nr:DNA polymerase III subunit gamma/tau [Rubrobacteraceae bacterium]